MVTIPVLTNYEEIQPKVTFRVTLGVMFTCFR